MGLGVFPLRFPRTLQRFHMECLRLSGFRVLVALDFFCFLGVSGLGSEGFGFFGF